MAYFRYEEQQNQRFEALQYKRRQRRLAQGIGDDL